MKQTINHNLREIFQKNKHQKVFTLNTVKKKIGTEQWLRKHKHTS